MLWWIPAALAVDVVPSAAIESGMQTSVTEDALVSAYTRGVGRLDLRDDQGDGTWLLDAQVSSTPRWYAGELESREQATVLLGGSLDTGSWTHSGRLWGEVDDRQRFGLVDSPEVLGEAQGGLHGESARSIGRFLVAVEGGARTMRVWEPTLRSPIASLDVTQLGGTAAWSPYGDLRVGVRGHGAWGWREAAPWFDLVETEHVRFDRVQAGMSGHLTPAWEVGGWTGQDRSLQDQIVSWEFTNRLDFGDIWFDHRVRHGLEPDPLVSQRFVLWGSSREVHAESDFGGFLDLASGLEFFDTDEVGGGTKVHAGGALGYGQDRWRASVEGRIDQQLTSGFTFGAAEANEFSRSWVGVRLDVGEVLTRPTPWRSP